MTNPKPEEFYSFEKALAELRLKDEELKRLVSENVIRAFRDGDRMKLRREDVEKLRSELSGTGATEELVFEDETSEEPGMATVPLAEAETIVEKTSVEKKVTRPIAAKPAAVAPAKKPAGSGIRTRPLRRETVPAESTGEPVWVVALLALTFVAMLVALPVALDVVKGTPGEITKAFVSAPK